MPTPQNRFQALYESTNEREAPENIEEYIRRKKAEDLYWPMSLSSLPHNPPPYPVDRHTTYIDNPSDYRRLRVQQRNSPSLMKELKSILADWEQRAGRAFEDVKEETINSAVDLGRDGVRILKGSVDLGKASIDGADRLTGGRVGKFLREKAGYDDVMTQRMLDDLNTHLEGMYTEKVRQAPIKRATPLDRTGDLAVDGLNSTIDYSSAIVGAADLVLQNRLGNALQRDFGFSPSQARKISSEWYSDTRKAENAKYAQAKGLEEKIKVLREHPAIALGEVVNQAPTFVLSKIHPGLSPYLTAGAIQAKAREEGIRWEESAPYAALGGVSDHFIGELSGNLAKRIGSRTGLFQPKYLEDAIAYLPTQYSTQNFTDKAQGSHIKKKNKFELTTYKKEQPEARLSPRGNLTLNDHRIIDLLKTQFPEANFWPTREGGVMLGKRHTQQILRSLQRGTIQKSHPDDRDY